MPSKDVKALDALYALTADEAIRRFCRDVYGSTHYEPSFPDRKRCREISDRGPGQIKAVLRAWRKQYDSI